MKKSIVLIFSSLFLTGFVFSQITVNSPLIKDTVKACSDYSDEVLQDRWDMNERTDLGWRIFNTVEMPYSYLTDISFQNGIFSAKSVYTPGTDNPNLSYQNITILDSAYLLTPPLGKTGKKFPINADKYTIFAVRMYLEPNVEALTGRLIWSTDTIYNGITVSNLFQVYDNWYIYMVDIPSLGFFSGNDSWSGLIDFLRLDPIVFKDKTIQIDWIRLVEYDSANERQITWSGNTGNVDIYLDDDYNSTNGNLGLLAKNVSGNNYTFLAGALMAGDYYVAIAPTGTTTYSYSSGYYSINDIPILRITKPSEEGSDTDFITTNFSDPWDMNNPEDIEYTQHISNAQFTSIDYEDLAGNSYSNQSVYYGESDPAELGNVGDPHVFFLHFLWRGQNNPIDTSNYHNLVFNMGLAGAHSTNDGSIVRVVYKNRDESVENVSEGIIIRHLDGKWIMHKVVCDLRTLPITEGAGSPSHTGWTGYIDSFRLDPHEFSNPRAFFFDDIKITTDWTANTSFAIEWTLSDSVGDPLVSLYYDSDNSGYDGTLIAENISAPSGPGSYLWDVSSVPEGKYWIHATVDDGTNQNRCYAGGPLIIDRGLIPEIELSTNAVYLGAERMGPSTSKEEVLITNTGQGSLNWQATASEDWIDVSPTSGTGNGKIEIGLKHTIFRPGTYTGTIRIDDSKALNSPQTITVNLTVYGVGADSAPFGYFDTPTHGSTVSGAIPVTGWAVDDIEVTKVEIKRSSDPTDSPAAIGKDGLVYIGDAVFVKGARTDIEALYTYYPLNDRAGWGYQMLTNFLPNQGNGTFIIYAFAYDGTEHKFKLGEKTIYCDNVNRIKPFGTIDTPLQGGTASGNPYVNWGWGLTPQPKEIPRDGSTIQVFIDSVPRGQPVYNLFRQDIYDLFPTYNNSDGAVGYYYLDTTQYPDGIHTISWLVEDDDGEMDGVGSRYFEILNFSGTVTTESGMDSLRYEVDLSERLSIDVEGEKEIEIEELGRIELKLKGEGGREYIGWGQDESTGLPIGSTLDKDKGIFYWMPGPGFLRKHILHFAVTDGMYRSQPVQVVVNIVPKKYKKSQYKDRKRKSS